MKDINKKLLEIVRRSIKQGNFKQPMDLQDLIDAKDYLQEEIKLNHLQAEARAKQEELRVISGSEILKMPIKEQPYIVEKMIPERAITALTADSGKGKSLFALILAIAIARGEKLFKEFEVKKNNVLIIDLEMDRDVIVSRFQSLVDDNLPIDYILEQPFNITDESDFNRLAELIKKNNYGLVIFDTISNIHMAEENSAKEMKEVNKQLLRLINEANISILYLHHNRKRRQDEKFNQSSFRGSTEIIAKVASHLLLDSKLEVNDDGFSVLKITIQQEKSRRPEALTKIGINATYDPISKKTLVDYVGIIDDAGESKKLAKNFVLENMEVANEYTVADFQKIKKAKGAAIGINQIRAALLELESKAVISFRLGEGRQHNTKFYRLKKINEL